MANEAGAGCASRSSIAGSYTFVSKAAPASISGSVVKLEMYCSGSSGFSNYPSFAFFTEGDSNVLSYIEGTEVEKTIDLGDASCLTLEAPDDFTAFSVDEGNYLGGVVAYTNTGRLYYSASGGFGLWYYNDLDIKQTDRTFTLLEWGNDALSADITAAGGAVSVPIMMANYRRWRQ